MIRKKRFIIFTLLLLLTLLLRDLPYVNIFFLDRIWVIYVLLFFFFIPLKLKFITPLLLAFFLLDMTASILKYTTVAEKSGVFVYFFLWISIILIVYDFFKSRISKK